MRHTLSRAFTVGRLIGILVVGAAALALPGTSTGRPAARAVQPPEQCAPAGNVVCDHLLETVTVPAGSTGDPSKIDLPPGQPYRLVVSGFVTRGGPSSGFSWNQDLFYCFGELPAGQVGPCSTGTLALASRGLVIDGGVLEFYSVRNLWSQPPPYSDSHEYQIPVPVGNLPLVQQPFSGTLSFSDYASGYPSSGGSFTVKIYDSNTETVRFLFTEQHHRLLKKHAFLLTHTLGGGTVVVPIPKDIPGSATQYVDSTSAKGTITYHKAKFSPHNVLLLDEDKLTLSVKKAVVVGDLVGQVFRVYALDLDVVVTKSSTDSCPLGSTGRVDIVDNQGEAHSSDSLDISIPACKLNDKFVGKPGGGGSVAVAITVDKPPPPP
jgi:hypothetical protein